MRDIEADWRRWSTAERIFAITIALFFAASASSLIGLQLG
jgi:hypothetical protein